MSKQLFLEQNLKAGEVYAGLILGKDGAPDYHLFRITGQVEDVDWKTYTAWVKSSGEAPTKRELSLMFSNIPEEFDKRAYWSGEQYESNYACAWYQHFNDCSQHFNRKGLKLRGVAVRRSFMNQ